VFSTPPETALPRIRLRVPTPRVLEPPVEGAGLRRAAAGALFTALFLLGAYMTQSSALARVPAPAVPIAPDIRQGDDMEDPWLADRDLDDDPAAAVIPAFHHPTLPPASVRHRAAPPSLSPDGLRILATAYTSDVDLTDDSPTITAANTDTHQGIVALSQDLLRSYTPGAPFDFGDTVELKGIGRFQVEDTMHPRWQRRADIWFPTREQALRWGRRSVMMKKVEAPQPKPSS
jgi:3D (Asp-Asp-Asp) domain-containing protein